MLPSSAGDVDFFLQIHSPMFDTLIRLLYESIE